MSELYSLLEDFREDYRHNPSFGSIILEDLYTSSRRIIILPIGRYLHVLTFLSEEWSLATRVLLRIRTRVLFFHFQTASTFGLDLYIHTFNYLRDIGCYCHP